MEHLVIDTCVWLDICVDPRLAPLLDALDRLCSLGAIKLVVPDTISQELERNSDGVQQKTKKIYEILIRDALDIGHILGNDADKEDLRRALGRISNALPKFQGDLNFRLKRVKSMLSRAGALMQESTDAMMLNAFRRGLSKKAPFTRGKNSCNDSLLLEHFAFYASSIRNEDRCAFVTSNKHDFSSPDNHRLPHPEIADLFDGSKRLFSINLAEHLQRIDSAYISLEVVRAASEAADRSERSCPAGGEHDFDPSRGANLRSRYGGLTWHIFCCKCGTKFDTGDSFG